MKEKKWKLHKGSAPIKRILLRHIGDRSDHRSDRRDAGADAKQFCGACAAQDFAGHHDLAAGLHLGATTYLSDHTVHVYNVYATLAGILCEAAKGAKIECCWIPGLNGACFSRKARISRFTQAKMQFFLCTNGTISMREISCHRLVDIVSFFSRQATKGAKRYCVNLITRFSEY